MKPIVQILSPLLLILGLSACQTLAEHQQEMGWEQGKTYTGTLNLTRFDLPLPPGEWTLTQVARPSSSDSGRRYDNIVLVRTDEENRITGVLATISTIPVGGGVGYAGWEPSPNCSAQNVILLVNNANFRYEQNCWFFASLYLNSDWTKPFGSDTQAYIQQKNMKKSRSMFVSLHHFTDREYLLNVAYYTSNQFERNKLDGMKFPNILLKTPLTREQLPSDLRPSLDAMLSEHKSMHDHLAALFKAGS